MTTINFHLTDGRAVSATFDSSITEGAAIAAVEKYKTQPNGSIYGSVSTAVNCSSIVKRISTMEFPTNIEELLADGWTLNSEGVYENPHLVVCDKETYQTQVRPIGGDLLVKLSSIEEEVTYMIVDNNHLNGELRVEAYSTHYGAPHKQMKSIYGVRLRRTPIKTLPGWECMAEYGRWCVYHPGRNVLVYLDPMEDTIDSVVEALKKPHELVYHTGHWKAPELQPHVLENNGIIPSKVITYNRIMVSE